MSDTIRASDAPIIVHCGKAAEPPAVEIDSSGPEASLGRAVHDSLEAWAHEAMIGEPEPEPYATMHGCDPHRVATLAQAAPALLDRCGIDFSTGEPEVTIKGELVRGRIDLLRLRTDGGHLLSAAVLDWKTGMDPSTGSKYEQRLAYASALESTHGMPRSGIYETIEVWLAADMVIKDDVTLVAIKGFRARIRDRLRRPVANPGPHCRYCRRIHECEERDIYIRAAASALAKIDPLEMTPDVVAALWDQSRALKKALEAYDKAVDALVDLTGDLPLPDGRKIIHTESSRDTIDARKAWATMKASGMTQDDINAVLTISKTKLLDAVGRLAPRGQKAAAKGDMMAALDVAGAISRSVTRRKRVVSPKKDGK